MKHFTFTIVGRSPMIVHNGGNISPLHPCNKLKSEYTKKRKKTDDDHINIARIEWFQSLYLDRPLDLQVTGEEEKFYDANKERPNVVLPIKCIRACVKSGAKLSRNGKAVDRAVQFTDVDFYRPSDSGKRLSFPDINKMSDDLDYIDETVMSVQRSKVVRYRAIFKKWAATVHGALAEEMLNTEDLTQAIQMAGDFEGINDSRSLGNGRFDLVDFAID